MRVILSYKTTAGTKKNLVNTNIHQHSHCYCTVKVYDYCNHDRLALICLVSENSRMVHIMIEMFNFLVEFTTAMTN